MRMQLCLICICTASESRRMGKPSVKQTLENMQNKRRSVVLTYTHRTKSMYQACIPLSKPTESHKKLWDINEKRVYLEGVQE